MKGGPRPFEVGGDHLLTLSEEEPQILHGPLGLQGWPERSRGKMRTNQGLKGWRKSDQSGAMRWRLKEQVWCPRPGHQGHRVPADSSEGQPAGGGSDGT